MAVSVLKESAVWKKNVHVQNWLSSNWLIHPQRWARAFRDNEFHAAVDTNNGTEAQNKVLKYKYMPKKKASPLLALVSLLVERFLPEAQQSYVLPNLKASEWYRRYNDFVPGFLQGRTRSIILHCLDRQSQSSKYDNDDLSEGEKEGVFIIQKRAGGQHVVDFSRNSEERMPSCSCKDWHIPYKHFFTVFWLKYAWNWEALPQTYRDSAYLSTDSNATDVYFAQFSSGSHGGEGILLEFPGSSDGGVHSSDIPLPTCTSTSLQQQIPVKGPFVQALAMTTRAVLHQIENLTYNVSEEERDTLTEKLKDIYSEFYRRMPHKDGLVLRPRDQRQVINMRRRVWKARAVLNCSSLPPWRRKKRAPSSYRNRFGIKADRLRRANEVNLRATTQIVPASQLRAEKQGNSLKTLL